MEDVPYGYCHCGCGKKTPIATYDRKDLGWEKGQPINFIKYHHLRSPNPQFIIDKHTGCWVWQRNKNNKGYGQLRVSGKLKLAHRVFYEKLKGKIKDGMALDHKCKNPACINPDHLEEVRHRHNIRRGNGTKLTWENVVEIRKLRSDGMEIQKIARRFNVSKSAIAGIIHQRKWRKK